MIDLYELKHDEFWIVPSVQQFFDYRTAQKIAINYGGVAGIGRKERAALDWAEKVDLRLDTTVLVLGQTTAGIVKLAAPVKPSFSAKQMVP